MGNTNFSMDGSKELHSKDFETENMNWGGIEQTHDDWKALNFFLSSKRYRNVSAARLLSQANNALQFALTAGHYLKQANLMKISLEMKENETLKHDAKNFKHLYEASWNLKIASVTARCQKFRKINKEEDKPKTKEFFMFNDRLCQKLTERPDHPDEQTVIRVAK